MARRDLGAVLKIKLVRIHAAFTNLTEFSRGFSVTTPSAESRDSGAHGYAFGSKAQSVTFTVHLWSD
jgi:hypothetical protein